MKNSNVLPSRSDLPPVKSTSAGFSHKHWYFSRGKIILNDSLSKPGLHKKFRPNDKFALADHQDGLHRLAYNEYITLEHALAYLAKADTIPHRTEGESVVLSFVPATTRRILDLGTGDGRLLSLLLLHCPDAEGVGIDFSPTMIDAANQRFDGESLVRILSHDLNDRLPDMGQFDAIVSSFAIHHCENARKRSLYAEIFNLLTPGGVFCNLEHVSSATPSLHSRFLGDLGSTPDDEDSGNILLDVETQLAWLRQIGFGDVDCYWKWLELSLFGGFRPTKSLIG